MFPVFVSNGGEILSARRKPRRKRTTKKMVWEADASANQKTEKEALETEMVSVLMRVPGRQIEIYCGAAMIQIWKFIGAWGAELEPGSGCKLRCKPRSQSTQKSCLDSRILIKLNPLVN